MEVEEKRAKAKAEGEASVVLADKRGIYRGIAHKGREHRKEED